MIILTSLIDKKIKPFLKGKKVLLISNHDFRTLEEFEKLTGAKATNVDDYLRDPHDFDEFEALVLEGGNTFDLMDLILEKEMSWEIHDFVREGRLIVAESAGAICLTPKLDMAQVPDYTADENNAELETGMKGLGIVSFELAVHYEDSHLADIKKYEKTTQWPIVCLRDGEFLRVI